MKNKIQSPRALLKNVNTLSNFQDWRDNDTLEWGDIDARCGAGEYRTVYIRNVSLEERMEADSRAINKIEFDNINHGDIKER